jgi:hypothetical protein
MSNTISEEEIVIKDELPEAEPIRALQVPVKIEENEKTKKEMKKVVSVKDNKLERFKTSTLDQEKVEPYRELILPVKFDDIDNTKKETKVVISFEENEIDRFEISTLDQGEAQEEQEVFTCDCKLTFKTEWQLKRHLAGYNVFDCEVCGKVCDTSSGLKQHSLTHKKTGDIQCDICKKHYKSISTLKKHTCKPLKCSICQKVFKEKSDLRTHELCHFSLRTRLGHK